MTKFAKKEQRRQPGHPNAVHPHQPPYIWDLKAEFKEQLKNF